MATGAWTCICGEVIQSNLNCPTVLPFAATIGGFDQVSNFSVESSESVGPPALDWICSASIAWKWFLMKLGIRSTIHIRDGGWIISTACAARTRRESCTLLVTRTPVSIRELAGTAKELDCFGLSLAAKAGVLPVVVRGAENYSLNKKADC